MTFSTGPNVIHAHTHVYRPIYTSSTYKYTYTFLPSSYYVCMKLLRSLRSTFQMCGLFAKFFPLHCFLFYFLLLPPWQQNTWDSLDKDKLSFRLCQFGEFNLSPKKEMDLWVDLQSWHLIGFFIPSAPRPVIDLDLIALSKKERKFVLIPIPKFSTHAGSFDSYNLFQNWK